VESKFKCESYAFRIIEKSNYPKIEEMAINALKKYNYFS
jgi:hypothetical protein